MCIPLVCCLLSCFVDVDLSLFLSSLPSRFRFRFGQRLFRPVFFLWVLQYAVSTVWVSAATRLAYDMHLDTYVHRSHLSILSEVYDLFQLRIVCSIFGFYLFFS